MRGARRRRGAPAAACAAAAALLLLLHAAPLRAQQPDAPSGAPSVQSAPANLNTPLPALPQDAPGSAEQDLVTWQLRVEAPDDLAKLLLRYLDLARYQRIGQTESITRGELQRLRTSTPAQVRALLETQGYFDAQVQVTLNPLTVARRAEISRLAALLRGRLLVNEDKPAATAGSASAGAGSINAGDSSTAGTQERAPAGADNSAAGGAAQQSEIEVLVEVEPGPRTTVSAVRIDFEGPLPRRAARAGAGQARPVESGAAAVPPTSGRLRDDAPAVAGGATPAGLLDADPDVAAAALLERVRSRWSLPVGAAYTQEAWSDAKATALATLRAEGYAAAVYAGSLARVNAEQHEAELLLVIDSGPQYTYGELRFEGLDHVTAAAPRALLTFYPGEPLREQPVLDYQDRLSKSGLFETIAVAIDPPPPPLDPLAPGAADQLRVPVVVKLRERPLHQLTLGAGYSDLTGPRVTLEHLQQSIFGWDWQAKTKVQLGRDAKSASLELTSHPQPGPYRNLASAAIDDTIASSLHVLTQRLRLGRSRDGERIERLYYVEYLHASTQPTGGGVRDDNSSLAYTYQWVWRDLDNPVLPTHGYALSTDASLGHTFHTQADSDWFGRATGRLTGYWQLGDAWYGQGRVQLGQVFARNGVSVPFTLLFRAGGDESVRGYAYQSLGPVDANGIAVGGKVLATGSLEIARPIARNIPSVWAAAFIDAGNATDSWQGFRPAVGWGVGLRWRSPVGPLRIDLAYGEQVRRVRLHFSVGITF